MGYPGDAGQVQDMVRVAGDTIHIYVCLSQCVNGGVCLERRS